MENHQHKHQPHSHGHGANNSRKLLWVTLLNMCITVAEIIGGLLSNSLALLSDAIHNLGDTLSIILAYIATKIARKNATEQKTFGYKRIEILAALLNALILVIITLFLFIEAYHRLKFPEPVKGKIMFWVASIGLLANLLSVLILKKEKGNNLNMRAAYLHLLGDTISSVAVIVGSVILFYYSIFWIDPLITFLIGIYILKEAYLVLKESIDILMQSTPESIEIGHLVKELEKFEQINNIHHVHAWKLDDHQIHFECHVDLANNITIAESDHIRQKLENFLLQNFGIGHTTIQFEYNCCNEKQIIQLHH